MYSGIEKDKDEDIIRRIIVPYLKENPQELQKLLKRFIELRPLAEEFVKCYYILHQAAKNGMDIGTANLKDLQSIVDMLNKIE